MGIGIYLHRPRSTITWIALIGSAVIIYLVLIDQFFWSRGAPPRRPTCIRNLRQVGLGLNMYAQDFDDKLPPMPSSLQGQAMIMPYIKNNQTFICPDTNLMFTFNLALSGQLTTKIKNQAAMPAIFDSTPHADGTWGIGYLDGHAGRVTAPPLYGTNRGKSPNGG